MRLTILGNSGSGKSTLARWLADHAQVPMLDLDTVAWEPGQIAVPRTPEAAKAAVEAFCKTDGGWVVEGCYGSLARVSLHFGSTLIFLDPGVEQCIQNCRSRPFEPHKYPNKEEQDARLEFLLGWVRDYYSRDGDMSHRDHLECYQSYAGPRHHVRTVVSIDPPDARLIEWMKE